MQLNPYLLMEGTSRAALGFYAEVLGTDAPNITTYGDMPEEMNIPDEVKDLVAHGAITVGSNQIMATDKVDLWHKDYKGIHGVSMQLEIKTVDEATRLFEAFSGDGGSVTMPLGPTFWAEAFGTCTDKFGVDWMISVSK